jgi:HemY protein
MKRFIIVFLFLLVSVWLGIKIHKDPGYVLITYQHWSMETTLWFAIAAILVIFIILYFLFRLARGTINLSGRFQQWSQQRQFRKANKLTHKGLCDLAEGDWQAAEKNLLRGAEHSEMPLINYLAAASAAQQQVHFEQRDNYLREAYHSDPEARVAIGLTQAQLQYSAKQWELALATLRHLQQLTPHHKHVLKLLKKVYLRLNDWESLKALLPDLLKQKILMENDLEQLERRVYAELLLASTQSAGNDNVSALWQNLSRFWQIDATLVAIYANYLIKHNEDTRAEMLIRDALKKQWEPELVRLYGLTKSNNLGKQLSTAEAWSKNHSNDTNLLLCLGRLSVHNQLWGKAREFFSASIQLTPSAAAYRELGQLLEKLGELQEAMECYRKGLMEIV